MSIAREALPFVLPVALAAAAAVILGHPRIGAALVLVALLLLAFFRIPTRRFAGDDHLVLAPANGVVTRIDRVVEPEIGPGEFERIVTFLSVFNVHIQRTPVGGKVLASRFREGRKIAAFRRQAGEVNQNHLVVIGRANGDKIGVRQIAGLVARRVVSYLSPGDNPRRGELMGLIKFGSRVDLFLPVGYRVKAEVGQRLVEGLTVVAEAPRETPEP